jgi:hypothetical protein
MRMQFPSRTCPLWEKFIFGCASYAASSAWAILSAHPPTTFTQAAQIMTAMNFLPFLTGICSLPMQFYVE